MVLLGWMQLFPKMNFHTILWSCLIWEGLGAMTVATYQMRLSMSVLQTRTLPAYVSDFLDPSSANSWLRPLIFLSHVSWLLGPLRGKVKPRVAKDARVFVRVKGVCCIGGELERGVSADLAQLTTAPEVSEYSCSKSTSCSTFLSSCMKNVESSAKAALVSGPFGVLIPLIATRAAASKGSRAITNSSGAIGSP